MNEENNFLYFTETLRLSRADELNLHLEQLRLVKSHRNRYQTESKETEKWVLVGYYSDVGLAAKKVLDLIGEDAIASGKATTIMDYVKELQAIKDVLISSVSKFKLQVADFPKSA